jgi:predicted nucleotidyltransferase
MIGHTISQVSNIKIVMKIFGANIPLSLARQKKSLIRCIDAMCGAMPVRQIVLFGSHARGQARRDSDVDLCIVAEGASHQIGAAQCFRRAMREIRPKPAFSLVPITPKRLAEKKRIGDHFFQTITKDGICLAKED